MTQRQVTLWLMALMAVGAFIVTISLIATDSSTIEIYATIAASVLFCALFWLYWRGWEPARYVLVSLSVVLAAVATQEPFVSERFSMAVFVPPTLALVLATPSWVVGCAASTMGILAIRAGLTGVYTEPVNIALYWLTIGTLILGRIMTNTAQRTAETNAERAAAALARSEQQSQDLALRTQEAQRSEQKFRTLANTTAAAIFICQHTQTRYVNTAAETLTGYSRSELLAMSMGDLFQLDLCKRDKVPAPQPTAQPQRPQRYELPIVTLHGETRWLDTIIGAIEFEDQPAILITAFDISDRKQAEANLQAERASLAQRVEERTHALRTANEELAQAARLKDEFLASMSHELRTPLNSILGMSEALQEGIYGSLPDSQQKSIYQIEQSGRHLLALINDILDLSKISAGKVLLNRSPVDVHALCIASIELISQAARQKQIRVSFTYDSKISTLNADTRRLKQILVNLLSNAVKFTDTEGAVSLEVYGDTDRSEAYFTVRDTGIGIAEEDLPRLFQAFVQLDGGLDRRYEGTGLGLVLVARLVDLHGGSVTVSSTVGEGSAFTVTIPWQNTPPPPPKPASSEITSVLAAPRHNGAVAMTATPLVLLAEDNNDNVIMISDYLIAKGYQIVVARNGLEAIEQAYRASPDLILMDIEMPELDGLEAIRRIRTDPNITSVPIIALTALVMPGDEERCLAAGANNYLSKPVSLKRLNDLIATHLHVNH